MKSAALELGEHGVTVNAVIPGLIDTTLTRHEDHYAQALAEAGQTPSGDPERDESAAIRALENKTPTSPAEATTDVPSSAGWPGRCNGVLLREVLDRLQRHG